MELAASFIHASKTQFAVDLYRNAPSAPRVKVRKPPPACRAKAALRVAPVLEFITGTPLREIAKICQDVEIFDLQISTTFVCVHLDTFVFLAVSLRGQERILD